MLRRVQALYSDSRAFGFLVSMFIFGAVLGVYGAVLNNYLHEILNISRLERGIVELPRELPGLLLFQTEGRAGAFAARGARGVLCLWMGARGRHPHGSRSRIRRNPVAELVAASTEEEAFCDGPGL